MLRRATPKVMSQLRQIRDLARLRPANETLTEDDLKDIDFDVDSSGTWKVTAKTIESLRDVKREAIERTVSGHQILYTIEFDGAAQHLSVSRIGRGSPKRAKRWMTDAIREVFGFADEGRAQIQGSPVLHFMGPMDESEPQSKEAR